MDISIGKVVHYKLASEDVQQFQQLRSAIEEQIDLPANMQGESVSEGEVFPAIVIKAEGTTRASLQVALPGFGGTLYVKSKEQGSAPGQWIYPELSEAGPYREHLEQVSQSPRGQKVGSR